MTELHDEKDNWISKTRRKKTCDNILELGEKMITMNRDELSQINMNDGLRHAIEEAQRMKSNGALKRQKHYIAKLMRNLNDETLPTQVNHILHKHDIYNAEFKRLEKWRDTMLRDGDQGINAFLEHYPQADRHHLRQLVRNAKKEQKNNKPPVAFRQIFRHIRETVDKTVDINENNYQEITD